MQQHGIGLIPHRHQRRHRLEPELQRLCTKRVRHAQLSGHVHALHVIPDRRESSLPPSCVRCHSPVRSFSRIVSRGHLPCFAGMPARRDALATKHSTAESQLLVSAEQLEHLLGAAVALESGQIRLQRYRRIQGQHPHGVILHLIRHRGRVVRLVGQEAPPAQIARHEALPVIRPGVGDLVIVEVLLGCDGGEIVAAAAGPPMPRPRRAAAALHQ